MIHGGIIHLVFLSWFRLHLRWLGLVISSLLYQPFGQSGTGMITVGMRYFSLPANSDR